MALHGRFQFIPLKLSLSGKESSVAPPLPTPAREHTLVLSPWCPLLPGTEGLPFPGDQGTVVDGAFSFHRLQKRMRCSLYSPFSCRDTPIQRR